MNQEVMNQIVKAYAYDQTPEQVAKAHGISVQEAERIKGEQKVEIIIEREYLKEMGYING